MKIEKLKNNDFLSFPHADMQVLQNKINELIDAHNEKQDGALKNCPWCNGEATIIEDKNGGLESFTVSCRNRGCSTSPSLNYWCENKQDAINAWNKRNE